MNRGRYELDRCVASFGVIRTGAIGFRCEAVPFVRRFVDVAAGLCRIAVTVALLEAGGAAENPYRIGAQGLTRSAC